MRESILPFVSVLTPTRDRRHFISQLVANFRKQTYPLDRMELIIFDDGDDPVGDLVGGLKHVKYHYQAEKITLGQKRNMLTEEARGEIIVHMDDDDYYPPSRVRHAVDKLSSGQFQLAGASVLYIYDIFSRKIVRAGPFGANHGTNGTFAYTREYLRNNRFDNNATREDEGLFTHNFTTPMIQLDAKSTILCISHYGNTIDKRNVISVPTQLDLKDFIKDKNALRYYRYQLINKIKASRSGSNVHC